MVGIKYFMHILMGHEIFFKIFDGPRNIFVCSIFIILFFKLKGSHPLSRYQANSGKNKKMFDAF